MIFSGNSCFPLHKSYLHVLLATFCLKILFLTSRQQTTSPRNVQTISEQNKNGATSSSNTNTEQTFFKVNVTDGAYGSYSTPRQPEHDKPERLPLDDHSPYQVNYKGIIFSKPDCKKKLLVYVCTDSQPCGGLADRQKGMISAFLLAIMTDRSLVIIHTFPCNIENFLEPNLYNWEKCRKDIKRHSHGRHEIKGYMLGYRTPFTFPNDLERYHGNDLWEEHVVSIHVNTRLQSLMKTNKAVTEHLPWLMTISEENIIKYIYEILFKNKPFLNGEILDFFQKHIHRNYLTCAHIRVGQNPSFKGVRRDRFFLNPDHLKKIFYFVRAKQSSKPGVLFLATDADQVKMMARRKFSKLVFLNTSIEHIDLMKNRSCEGMHDALLEQQILSHCNTLIMTSSGFSRMAAFIGGNMDHIFTSKDQISTEIEEVLLATFCLTILFFLICKQQSTSPRNVQIISEQNYNEATSSSNTSTKQTLFKVNITETTAGGTYGSYSTPRQPQHDKSERLPLDDHSPYQVNYEGIIFSEPDCNKKLLVYVCTDSQPCGGLADRQKGMISAFLLAIMTNRSLVIIHTFPCNIEKFLEPNLYNWRKCRQDIDKNSNSTHEIKDYILTNYFTFPNDLERYHGNDLWAEHVVSIHVNTRLQSLMKTNKAVAEHLPWLMTISEENIIKYIYEILFKNKQYLNREISDFFQRHIQRNYLTCAHIRVGQNPSFKGVRKDRYFLNPDHVKKIFHFIQAKQSSKPGVLFLATDADQVKMMARQHFSKLVFLNTSIEHIDLMKNRSCEGTGTHDAILEQQILSRCNTLIMTSSGFSRMAAFIGGNIDHIFTSKDQVSTEIEEVTLNQLTKMYGPFT